MTPISADDLEFDEAGGAVDADSLPFDFDGPSAPFNGVRMPAPPKPKVKPSKKPRQPVATLGDMRKQAQRFSMEPSRGVPVVTPPPVKLDATKVRRQAQSFEAGGQQEGLQLERDDSAPEKFRVAGVQRRSGETMDSFLKREKVWREQDRMRQVVEKSERGAMRAQMLPKMNPEAAFIQSVGEGFGEGIRQGAVGLSLLTGEEPTSVALEQGMPRMNAEQAQSFWTGTLGQGLGSMAAFGTIGALTGPVGIALAGAAQNGGQTYEEARLRGVSHDEALAAAVNGALIGALEGVGGGGGAAKGFLKGTFGEVTQEVSSQLLNNVNAKIISGYDPQRAISEGLLETAAVAGLLGGGAHALGNLGEVAKLPSQFDAKLRELGIEQSFGDLDDAGKQAGVELYSGLDPKLIRDFLPRPETIKSLFSSLFKGLKGSDTEIDQQIESSRLRLFEQIANRKYEKMKQLPTHRAIRDVSEQEINETMNVPQLPQVWDDLLDGQGLRDQLFAEHYSSDFEFPNGAEQLVVRHKQTGEEVGRFDIPPGEITPDNDPMTMGSFAAARDAYFRSQNKSDPELEIAAMFGTAFHRINRHQRNMAQLEIEKEFRSTEKHVRRWLDKQKWEAERRKRKDAGPGMASRLGDEPQGIVVHKISAAKLNRLLQEAEGDISKAQQPMPSIGIIHPGTDFNSFGGVQLVATPSLIEDAVKAGTAYPTDFYTPTAADAIYKIGEDRITPENVQRIVDEMIKQTNQYGERRLSEPQAVFSNAAIFNSYAKAGGAFESMDAVKEGLGALKPGAKTKSTTPEFAETREAQNEFNTARNSLYGQLAGLTHPNEWEAVKDFEGWPVDPDDPTDGVNPMQKDLKNYDVAQQIDQYLLTQLSRPTLPSAEGLEAGLRKLIGKQDLSKPFKSSYFIEENPDSSWSVFGPQGLVGDFNTEMEAKVEYERFSAAEKRNTKHVDDPIKELAQQAAKAFATFRNAPTIYMEAQPPRGVRLDEYVAALVPGVSRAKLSGIQEDWQDANTGDVTDRVADTLAAQGIKVYRYSSPEEKVAIQKALAQFKDVVINPASNYGALYSNPVFDPEVWKRAKQAWLPGMPDPEVELLAGAEHVAGPPPVEPPATPDDNAPNLFHQVLMPEHLRDIATRVAVEVRKSGMELRPDLSLHMQIVDAVRRQPDLLRANPEIVAVLEAGGLTEDQLISSFQSGASDAGRALQAIQSDMAYAKSLVMTDPTLARKALGDPTFIREALKQIGETELGMSRWGRMGFLAKAMALGRLATFWTNIYSTAGYVLLDAPASMIASLGEFATDNQAYRTSDTQSQLDRGKAALAASIQPHLETLWRFTPRQLEAKLKREAAVPGSGRYDAAIAELSASHPEIVRHLFNYEYASMKVGAEGRKVFEELGDAFAKRGAGTDRTERKEDRRWRELQARDNFNGKLAGKVLAGTEALYSIPLKPMIWQETAFRKPLFVGALERALRREGKSLAWMMDNARNQISGVDGELVERAVNEALTLTWGWRPQVGNEQLGFIEKGAESAAAYYVKAMNALGPGAVVVGDLFARSTTNAAKFAWEFGPWGMISPGWRLATGASKEDGAGWHDAQRVSRAMVGTTMYALAYGLMSSQPGDDEWYKIPTGRKDKAGKPISFDARNIPQLAIFMKGADLARRVKDGRLGELEAGKELMKVYVQARQTAKGAEQASVFEETLKYWSTGESNEQAWLKGQKPIGDLIALPMTPLLNLRDLVAQFDPEAAQLRDTAAEPLLGPLKDKIPWLRNSLPVKQPFTEPAPQEMSARSGVIGPITNSLLPGLKTPAPLGFASREFARLGLKPTHFLAPVSDPIINRAQYAAYAELLEALSPAIENDPAYQTASAAEQAARWEQLMLGAPGRKGVAAIAKAAGEKANPPEVQLQKVLEKGPGPLQNKASGLTQAVQEERRKAKEQK